MSNKFDISIPVAILGLAFSVAIFLLPYFTAPGWLITGILLWLGFSLIALLFTTEPKRRKVTIDALHQSRFTQIYTKPATKITDWFWSHYCDNSYQGHNPALTFRHALTWRLYDKAMLLAVVYPIWAIILIWIITGQDAKLGDVVVFPVTGFWPERATAIGVIAMLVMGTIVWRLAAKSQSRVMKLTAEWLLIITAVFAVTSPTAVAFTFGIAFAGAVAIGFAIAVVFAGTIGGAGAGAFAVAFAFAGAGGVTGESVGMIAYLIAGAVALFASRRKRQMMIWFVSLILPLVWIALLLLLTWADVNAQKRGFYIFLGIFPLLNALFDTVSYAVTLTLLRLGLRGRWPFLNGVMDLVIAMVLFLVLGATLALLITGMNALADTPMFDLGVLFSDIRKAPSDYWWLYIMMFSTLLPTVAHMALAMLSLQSLIPLRIRRPVANLLNASTNHTLEATLAPFAVGAVWVVPFLVVGAAIYWGWGYVGGWLEMVGWFYLDTLEALTSPA